ncbi:MAG: type IV secretion system protein [Gammaproteobacteria bacterium]|jgi:hypothetical protein
MRNFILFLLCIYSACVAAVTPVVDHLAIQKILLMLNQLEDQYDRMKDQLDEAKLHTDFLSGENSFSDIYNTDKEKHAREWAPNSIEDFEDMIAQGFNPGDLADRYEYYQYKFPGIDIDQIDAKNPNSAHRNLYEYNEEWTKLNLAGFAQTFDAVNASYERINNLLDEVNKHDTLKQSSDFSNRLLGELAYLLQQLIQVQNFELHINAMLQQGEQNHIAAHTQFYTFRKK